jgi:hypothetical protein
MPSRWDSIIPTEWDHGLTSVAIACHAVGIQIKAIHALSAIPLAFKSDACMFHLLCRWHSSLRRACRAFHAVLAFKSESPVCYGVGVQIR